jgi:hypothetical protein
MDHCEEQGFGLTGSSYLDLHLDHRRNHPNRRPPHNHQGESPVGTVSFYGSGFGDVTMVSKCDGC